MAIISDLKGSFKNDVTRQGAEGASRNFSADGNFCFKPLFKLQLKVFNKNVCYLYSYE